MKALRERLGNIGGNELDIAINALQRAKRVRVVNKCYEVIPSTRPLGGMPHTGRPPSADEEAAGSLLRLPVKEDVPGSSPGVAAILGASTQPVIADRVFENVKAQRQAALNKLALLQVEIGNLQAYISERETFLALYERFAQGATG